MTTLEQVRRRLAQRFQEAMPILFTGAGFSASCVDRKGRPLPVGDQLRKEIWSLCYPNESCDDTSTLSDVYHVALRQYPKQLAELLRERLTVDAARIPPFYADYFGLPWKRIYTLNIDDVAEAANRSLSLPCRLRPYSALLGGDASDMRRADQIDVVHLNGVLSGVPENVTFSTLQYAARQATWDANYARLASDLLSHPVVFVGTRIDEFDFWKYIELRKTRARSARELRPNSLLVTRTLSIARKELLRQFNIDWLQMSADEFARDVLSHVRVEFSTDDVARIVRSAAAPMTGDDSLPRVSHLVAERPVAPSEFLWGQEPIWADITTERAVPRSFDAETLGVAREHLASGSGALIINIVGTAGSGKSTSLMRLAASIASMGEAVGYVAKSSDLSPRAIVRSLRADAAMRVVAVDDADRYSNYINDVIDVVCERAGGVVILAMRSQKVARMQQYLVSGSFAVREMVVPHLTDADIDLLIASLERASRLGRLAGMTPMQRRACMQEQAGRQLLVAMIQATSGEKFEEKAVKEYRELEGREKFVYACLAVVMERGHSLTREQVLMAAGDASNATLNDIDNMIRRQLVVSQRPDARGPFSLRHQEIARIVFADIAKEKNAGEVLASVAWTAAQAVRADMQKSSRPWRLVKSIINHDYLKNALDVEQARSVYAEIEGLLNWDFHYWLQRGSLELEVGNLRDAASFLVTAKSLKPDDPFVQTEHAYLEFRLAIASKSDAEAVALADSAIATLEDLIRAHGERFPHAYHVLAAQGMAWLRRGVLGRTVKRDFARRVIDHLVDGCRKHPFNEDLAQLRKNIERELLMMSVD